MRNYTILMLLAYCLVGQPYSSTYGDVFTDYKGNSLSGSILSIDDDGIVTFLINGGYTRRVRYSGLSRASQKHIDKWAENEGIYFRRSKPSVNKTTTSKKHKSPEIGKFSYIHLASYGFASTLFGGIIAMFASRIHGLNQWIVFIIFLTSVFVLTPVLTILFASMNPNSSWEVLMQLVGCITPTASCFAYKYIAKLSKMAMVQPKNGEQ